MTHPIHPASGDLEAVARRDHFYTVDVFIPSDVKISEDRTRWYLDHAVRGYHRHFALGSDPIRGMGRCDVAVKKVAFKDVAALRPADPVIRDSRTTEIPAVVGEGVGVTAEMPGSNGGFTMAAFKASDVPVGTALYATPASHDALIARAREVLGYLIADHDVRVVSAEQHAKARALLADLDAGAGK